MISRVFIDRPIFAWVLAIIVMLAGAGAIALLPVAQYPDVAPPQVTVRTVYPGASAQTLEDSVTQVIEQTLSGMDGLLYFASTSTSRGQVTITATFEKGVNPDIAQVQVQNKVQQAVSRLPQAVQQQGLRVTRSSPDDLMIVGVYDESDKLLTEDVSDFVATNLQDLLGRVEGVGETEVFGSPYAMRVWLDPHKLAGFQLMPSDVIRAIEAQNADVAAGEVGGQPQPATQMLNAIVTAQSRLTSPEQFRQVILKSDSLGATVRLHQVARVELGADSYSFRSRINQHPSSGLRLILAPGADALQTAARVRAEVERIAATFPPEIKVIFFNDSTDFIKVSINEVVKTLVEAIGLVVLVMFVFLQNWRATLIPTIAVPVVLLGTFAVFYATGFSINTLTLFGLVLAIGLLVDDAIVVVENVERLLHENPQMTPREATLESMKEISTALIGITVVLSAVFVPMALFGGSIGVIYRQFSVTMVSAMVLSACVALTLTPALTASLLKQRRSGAEAVRSSGWLTRRMPKLAGAGGRFSAGFNRHFDRATERYRYGVRHVIQRKWLYLAIYVGLAGVLALLFGRLPTGFLPNEDQGRGLVQFRLPPGATIARTDEVRAAVEDYVVANESQNVTMMLGVSGSSGQNAGQAFFNFAPWDQRTSAEDSTDAILKRTRDQVGYLRDAQLFAVSPPPVRGLGSSSGFTLNLQNTGGLSREAFIAARDQFMAAAQADPSLAAVRLTDLPPVDALNVRTDAQQLAALGLAQGDVNATLSTAWGGSYVNDFIDRGRVKRVHVQGDAEFRSEPSDLADWQVRGEDGRMTPFSAFAATSWSKAPTSIARFNGISAFEVQGQAAPGRSSGEAMERLETHARDIQGISVAWAGLSFQERLSSGQAPLLYALSLLVVFLCLAALYESWSVPVAVLLVVPLGLIGAVLAVTLRGLVNDVYLQIGLLTTMGLAAKNAILIVEFAEQAHRRGQSAVDAVLEAARLRLRPILMTSLAFICGVLPLALAQGAGANSRIAIGTSVIGGMLTATILAVFYIPMFFVVVRQWAAHGILGRRKPPHPTHPRNDGEMDTSRLKAPLDPAPGAP